MKSWGRRGSGRRRGIARRLLPVLAAVALVSAFAAAAVLGADQDAETPASGAPKCLGRVATVVGTPGPDDLEGREKADVIVGLGGADELKGRKGNDIICGGAGDDRMAGGKGNDKILGGKGRDGLKGGPGKDTLIGGPDPDKSVQ